MFDFYPLILVHQLTSVSCFFFENKKIRRSTITFQTPHYCQCSSQICPVGVSVLPVDTGRAGTVPENTYWECWLQPKKQTQTMETC